MSGCGVHRAEADTAIVGGQHHPGARLDICTIGDGPLEIATDQFDAQSGIAVDKWMRLYVGEGFHAVGEGVDARRGGHRGGHRIGELGVEHRHVGQHVLALHGQLGERFRIGDQRAGARFRAGTRCGGNLNQTCASTRYLAGTDHFGNRLLAVPEHGDELGDVHGRSAAQADHQVWFERPRRIEHGLDRRQVGLGRQVDEDLDRAVEPYAIDKLRGRRHGDDKDAVEAVGEFTQPRDRAGPDLQFGRLRNGDRPGH